MQTCSCHLVCTSCTGYMVGERNDSASSCVATPALHITSFHPVPLSHFKDAISMWNSPRIRTRLLNSTMIHWICFAKANSDWSNAMTGVCERSIYKAVRFLGPDVKTKALWPISGISIAVVSYRCKFFSYISHTTHHWCLTQKYNVPKYYEKYQRWARDGIRVKMTHWLCRKALSFKRIFYS